MNWYEILFCIIVVIAIYRALTFKISDKPDESNSRVRYDQTHPEQVSEPVDKIIPSYTSKMISQNRFDKLGVEQYKQLNEDYLKLIQRLNDEVIF